MRKHKSPAGMGSSCQSICSGALRGWNWKFGAIRQSSGGGNLKPYLVARAGKAILLRLSAMLCNACDTKKLLCNMHEVE